MIGLNCMKYTSIMSGEVLSRLCKLETTNQPPHTKLKTTLEDDLQGARRATRARGRTANAAFTLPFAYNLIRVYLYLSRLYQTRGFSISIQERLIN